MRFLRTLGWLACVVYSTIPLFWLMVHPRAHRWRATRAIAISRAGPGLDRHVDRHRRPDRPVAERGTLFGAMDVDSRRPSFCAGIFIYSSAGAHFSWAQFGGLPEVRTGNQAPAPRHHWNPLASPPSGLSRPSLRDAGLERRDRLAVCWLLTAFAIAPAQ